MIASEYQAEKVNIDQRKQFILMASSQMATTRTDSDADKSHIRHVPFRHTDVILNEKFPDKREAKCR